MDLVPCLRHSSSKICFIHFTDDAVKLICDQCLDENVQVETLKMNQILSIRKLLIQPEYILLKLNWSGMLQKFAKELVGFDKSLILQQINQLESQMKYLQEQITNLFNDFKKYAQRTQELKELLVTDIFKILDYEQLKKILQGLTEPKVAINSDSIGKIQEQLNQYFGNIKQGSGQKVQKELVSKIEDTALQIESENQLLEKYDDVAQRLQQLYVGQQKLTNYIFPNIQINDQLSQSKIIRHQYFAYLQSIIKDKVKKPIDQMNLIYLGSRDGLNAQQFWSKVNGKKNLLMIFKSKSSYVFGGYSPCQWLSSLSNYAKDTTNSSFLFSQNHNEIYPIKQSEYPIYCKSDQGPTFGGGHDLSITADFQGGYSNLGHTFKWDKYQSERSSHLCGQWTPGIIECEIYEFIF